MATVMDFNELNVSLDARHEHAILDLFNYVCAGVSRVTSILALRDANHLINAISAFEKSTGWQSSRVIDMFFKYKNDAISGYVFINGWLDTYYNCGHIIAGDGLRFANDREVMTIAILVANVFYSRRQSLNNNDLKLRLDAVWIDLNSVADWVLLWIRTRAQLIPTHTTLHSCAHQLFSGHSLYEYQAIQQRLTLMVQQKLINEQNKKLADQELVIEKHAKDYANLREKLCEILQEVDVLKKSHSSLIDEVKWLKDVNRELNDTVVKLGAENDELKHMNGSNDNNNSAIGLKLSDEDECLESIIDIDRNHHQNHRNIYSHMNASSSFKCNNVHAINGNISGLDINDRNVDDKQHIERIADITHHSSTEDITDSGNHSDAADDLLIDIYQCCSPKQPTDKDDSESQNDSLFNYHSWHEFFSKHGDSGGNSTMVCNITSNNNNSNFGEHDDHSNRNNDTYKSIQHFGSTTTNSDNICINF